jgi:hypothetical protein
MGVMWVVYVISDVLLTDPLSAVYAHVGWALFNGCICGTLKHKTRVLVTHQLQVTGVVVLDACALLWRGSERDAFGEGSMDAHTVVSVSVDMLVLDDLLSAVDAELFSTDALWRIEGQHTCARDTPTAGGEHRE